MRKKEREHYLKAIFILWHAKHVENEDLYFILSKKQDQIIQDLDQLKKDGFIYLDDSFPSLTVKGLEIAKKLYRSHELYEDFFKNILKISHKEAHKLSDALEHVSSKEFETKIHDLFTIKKFIPLTFLKRGEKGRFIRIDGGRTVTRRLSELGIIGDVEILVKEDAPTGGPIKISVRNSDLMIGYGEAKKIIVEVINK